MTLEIITSRNVQAKHKIHSSLQAFQSQNSQLIEGYLPIDNNDTERKIKPFAVGRKNWLFSGNSKGAQASANLFTLIENAKLHFPAAAIMVIQLNFRCP